MIEVEVLILPQRIRKRGRIDPSASFDRIKADIIKTFGLGEPDDYSIMFRARSGKLSPKDYQPSSGDLVVLTQVDELGGPAFEPLEG